PGVCATPRRGRYNLGRRRRCRAPRTACRACVLVGRRSCMPLFSFEGLTPQVHGSAFLAPTATLVGDVIVEAGASIWYGAVIRADYAPVIVRQTANVQDNAVIHGPPGLTSDIGRGATVGHNCVVHGAILEEECLVANGCVVLDGATIGARALIAAGSVCARGGCRPRAGGTG